MTAWLEWKSHIKKEPKYKERKEVERKQFIDRISKINPKNLVFIDETGINNNIVTQYGWSKKGFKSYAEQSGFRAQRLNIIAGYKRNLNEIIAPFEYKGYTDSNLFNYWFEEQLLPVLNKGDVVILDNASFHKDPELQSIAEGYDVKIIYLPPYSPDLNPIEKLWANLKRNIRKIIKHSENLQDAITKSFMLTLSC